jgi:hypothetical protein
MVVVYRTIQGEQKVLRGLDARLFLEGKQPKPQGNGWMELDGQRTVRYAHHLLGDGTRVVVFAADVISDVLAQTVLRLMATGRGFERFTYGAPN